MAEHRQAEGGLGDEDVAGDRLERRAGGVAPALVIPRDHHGQAARPDHDLGRAQHVAGGNEGDLHRVAHDPLAIGGGLGRSGEALAVALRHDRQGLGRGQHRAVARARMIRVSVGDHRPGDRRDRVDPDNRRGRSTGPAASGGAIRAVAWF